MVDCLVHPPQAASVRIGSSLSSSFETECGTQQGEPLAGLLFNLYLEPCGERGSGGGRG